MPARKVLLTALCGAALSVAVPAPGHAEQRSVDGAPVTARGPEGLRVMRAPLARHTFHHRDRAFFDVPLEYWDADTLDAPSAPVIVAGPPAPQPPPALVCPPGPTGSSFTIEETNGVRVIRGRQDKC